jgi:hypothetical protein
MSMSPDPAVDPAGEPTGAAPAPASPSRRSFVRTVGLGAAALGAATATGAALTGVVSAQAAGDTSEVPELSDPDVEIVRFLQSISLAAEEILLSAVDNPQLTDSAQSEELRTFAKHHADHAERFGTLLPEDEQVTDPNPTLTTSSTSAVDEATDATLLLGQVLELEEQLAATMLASVTEAESFLVARAIAAVLPVVSQQAAAIGGDLGAPIDTWLPAFGTTDGALTPAQFPIS